MDHTTAMRRALALARSSGVVKGPNPAVGCVLLDRVGNVVAEGFHRGPGTAHAEAMALQLAGATARGTTAVVTLEPCAHHGRTPPCAEALLREGVTRVVYGQADPNPKAAGGGDVLRAGGVEVIGGVLAHEAQAVNPIWTEAMVRGRPIVTWKVAATLDGQIAASDGTSKWITSPQAREQVHALRAQCDAVLTGSGTLAADDPLLSARPTTSDVVDQPLRVVMGMTEVPLGAAIHGPGDGLSRHLRTRDPQAALAELMALEVRSVLLECGPRLASSFLRAGLIDRIVWFTAPLVLGSTGTPVVDEVGVGTLADAKQWQVTDVKRVGPDIRIELSPGHAVGESPGGSGAAPVASVGSRERKGWDVHRNR